MCAQLLLSYHFTSIRKMSVVKNSEKKGYEGQKGGGEERREGRKRKVRRESRKK